MKILSSVYQEIISNCSSTIESGGIIGLSSDIITHYQFDIPTDLSQYYYQPNTDNLNSVIQEWQQNNIQFAGIFHSHPTGITSLSVNDKEYIKEIMHTVPLTPLYFPIVAPASKIQLYKASLEQDDIVIISNEPITITRNPF